MWRSIWALPHSANTGAKRRPDSLFLLQQIWKSNWSDIKITLYKKWKCWLKIRCYILCVSSDWVAHVCIICAAPNQLHTERLDKIKLKLVSCNRHFQILVGKMLSSTEIADDSLSQKGTSLLGLGKIPGYPPDDVGIRVWIHLEGYPNPNVNREMLQVLIRFSRCFPWFLLQIMKIMIYKFQKNLIFSVCKYGFGISLSDMWEFRQILLPYCFCRKNLRFLRKPRWCGYPPGNYIPDPGT